MERTQRPQTFLLLVLTCFQVGTVTAVSSYTTSLTGMVSLDNWLLEGEVFNSSVTTPYTYQNCTVAYLVDDAADKTQGGQQVLDPDKIISKTGQEVFPDAVYPSLTTELKLSITEEVNSDDANFMIQVENIGATTAYDIEVEFELDHGLKMVYSSFAGDANFIPAGGGTVTYVSFEEFLWNPGTALSAGNSKSFTFTADIRSDVGGPARQENLLSSAYLYYNNTNTGTIYRLGPTEAIVCIKRTVHVDKSILYRQGFTALAFFMALILGVLLVCLGWFIYLLIRRKKAVSPEKANENRMMAERGKTIILNENEAMRRGGHTINMYSSVGEGDSIVGVLAMKDKMQMHRELDSVDIVNTVNVDTGLEKERNDAAMNTTELLIQGLSSNKDISTGMESAVIAGMRKRRSHMDRQHDDEYKREMKKLYKKISAKNRAMMSSLAERQRDEKKELISATQDLPAKERNDVLKLISEKHLAEQNAETYRLKLEQDEESEKLRKEFAVRTRVGLKEIQQQTLNDVKTQGNLSKQQADWLMAEHLKNQKALESMYDDEISRQRMILEEKLARRKAHAQASETQEEDQSDLLNTRAGQQIVTIEKMKKQGIVSSLEAEEMIAMAKKEMVEIKERMDRERERQEVELHKKLSALKQKRLADMVKQHDAEIKEYDKKSVSMQTDGPIDPVLYAEGRLKLLSQQRLERSNLENQLDSEHMEELTSLRNNISTQTETQLKDVERNLHLKLPQDGRTEELAQRLIRQHEKELAALRATQEKQRREQEERLQEQLARNREEWSQKKEAEKTEQEQLREYEDSVISKLVNSQVCISEEERDKILKEHEKQMVNLENSLTLNKLRQKRMVEERLAMRRAQQMEKLQQKQHRETEAQRRSFENNGEESDEESHLKQLDLKKQHIEQRMAVLQGRKLNWDSELEAIRIEMLKERSLALKEQEERLGALVAGLQLAKAKELAKIEEQQKAIHGLKTNLIDELNARGVLSDPETQAVIRRHQQEQKELNERLEQQRQKQEQLLRQKLEQRLAVREKSMMVAQEEEMKNLVAPNKTAAKIKKMLLIHKHMVAMEKLRNQLEREVSQSLEQVKYEYDLTKKRAIQNQELDFIAGLIRVGAVQKSELEAVLHMLYPTKTEAEFKEMFDKLYDPDLQPKGRTKDKSEDMSSSLLDRVRNAQMPPGGSRPSSRISDRRSLEGSIKRNSLRKNKPTFDDRYGYEDEDMMRTGMGDSIRKGSLKKNKPAFDDRYGYEDDDVMRASMGDSVRKGSLKKKHLQEDRYDYEDEANFNRMNGSLRKNSLKKKQGSSYEDPYQGYDNEAHFNRMGAPIREHSDDDDVMQAHYMGDSQYTGNQGQPPSKLPPLQPQGKKKKKKKFLKKMAHHDDDDDLL